MSSVDTLRSNPQRVVKDLVFISLSAQLVSMLWGPPGVGKTELIISLSRMKDENDVPYQVIVMQPSTQDPTIIHGMFYVSREEGVTVMRRSVPETVEQIVNYWEEKNGLTILFLDEMTTCAPSQQSAFLGVMTHGVMGGVDVTKLTTQIMAANPPKTVMGTIPIMESALNRACHYPVYGEPDLYLEGFRSGFGVPENAPTNQQFWYMENIIAEAQGRGMEIFRDDGKWTVDDLVPYHQLKVSPRSMSNWSSLTSRINEIFGTGPDEVRHHYLSAATKAYLGPELASVFDNVLEKEDLSISWNDIYTGKLEGVVSWSTPDIPDTLRSTLLSGKSSNHDMPYEQLQEVMDSAAAVINSDYSAGVVTDIGESAALVLWAAIESAQGVTKSQLYRYSPRLIQWGALLNEKSGKTKVPEFLSRESREEAVKAVKAKMG